MKSTFVIDVEAEELAKLAAQGLNAQAGTLPKTQGVVLSYVVSGGQITFTVEEKPFLVPVSAIQSHIKNLLQG